MTCPISQAQQTINSQIIAILQDGRMLRQYKIAEALDLNEHHNWSTAAALKTLVADGILSVSYYHVVCKNNRLSKIAYPHYSLAIKTKAQTSDVVEVTCTILPRRIRPMRFRDVLKDWAHALGF